MQFSTLENRTLVDCYLDPYTISATYPPSPIDNKKQLTKSGRMYPNHATCVKSDTIYMGFTHAVTNMDARCTNTVKLVNG